VKALGSDFVFMTLPAHEAENSRAGSLKFTSARNHTSVHMCVFVVWCPITLGTWIKCLL